MFMCAGLVGYMKWGENVAGSLTLNLGDTMSVLNFRFKKVIEILILYFACFLFWFSPQWGTNCEMYGLDGCSVRLPAAVSHRHPNYAADSYKSVQVLQPPFRWKFGIPHFLCARDL